MERPGERRRRYYRLTPMGRKALARERRLWKQFVTTVSNIVGVRHA